MKESEQASLSIKKIALITIFLIFMLGVGVRATTDRLNTVEIILSDNYKIEVKKDLSGNDRIVVIEF